MQLACFAYDEMEITMMLNNLSEVLQSQDRPLPFTAHMTRFYDVIPVTSLPGLLTSGSDLILAQVLSFLVLDLPTPFSFHHIHLEGLLPFTDNTSMVEHCGEYQ